ncbi:MAG: Gfo/Idh/MocA family oxidoreductase [Ignavibacteria bacterium]
MSKVNKYSASIIGCGDIGYRFDADWSDDREGALTHFRAIKNSDRFDLITVAEKNKETLEAISSHSNISCYENYNSMLIEQKPDVIAIVTNDESHYKILNDILNIKDYKPKFVFCEKPLALNFNEIESVCKHYNNVGIPLQVNYTRRFLNEFIEIKKDIDQQKTGRIESVTFYYSRGIVHNASHYIDLALWYFGIPDEVLSFSSKKGITNADKSVSFIFKYNKGPELIFIGLDTGKLSFAEIDIVGISGRIKFNFKNEIERYEVISNPVFIGYTALNLESSIPVKFEYALPNAYENIYDVMKNKKEMHSPAENSIKIFDLINKIRENRIWQN